MRNKIILKNFILLFIALLILAVYVYMKIHSGTSIKNTETMDKTQSAPTNQIESTSSQDLQPKKTDLLPPQNSTTKNAGGELAAPKRN